MLTIAIVSQKGGAGKTTLAVHLSTAANASGVPMVILEADSKATASRWGIWRSGQDPDMIDCGSHSLLPVKLATIREADLWISRPFDPPP